MHAQIIELRQEGALNQFKKKLFYALIGLVLIKL